MRDSASMRRLKVGARSYLTEYPRASGHGRVWRDALAALRGLTSVRLYERPPGAPGEWKAPDVWIVDGHGGPHHTYEPAVAVVHEAGWATGELRSFVNPESITHLHAMTGHAIASASRVVVPSQSAARDVSEVYDVDPDRIDVVPYGVDHVTFRPMRDAPREIAAPYVLFCASLSPRKNLAALRTAMGILAREGFPHRLAIVAADASDRTDSSDLDAEAMAELPGAPGRLVRIRNPDDQRLAALMTHAAAFCMPSFWEGFGLTVVEAMACGTPVVVSDRGSLPELVADAGVVITPEPDAVAEALRHVLGDEATARDLSRRSVDRAAGFSWDRTASGWLSALATAVTGAARHTSTSSA